jgi:hypothetical protein
MRRHAVGIENLPWKRGQSGHISKVIFDMIFSSMVLSRAQPLPYGASTITSSESSIAVILTTATSLMAAPSRASILTLLISTAPAAGTR